MHCCIVVLAVDADKIWFLAVRAVRFLLDPGVPGPKVCVNVNQWESVCSWWFVCVCECVIFRGNSGRWRPDFTSRCLLAMYGTGTRSSARSYLTGKGKEVLPNSSISRYTVIFYFDVIVLSTRHARTLRLVHFSIVILQSVVAH